MDLAEKLINIDMWGLISKNVLFKVQKKQEIT